MAPMLVGGQAPPDRHRPGPGADDDAPRAPARRRRGLPLHPLRAPVTRSAGRYCGLHESVRPVRHGARRGVHVAGRLRPDSGRQPALRDGLRCTAAATAPPPPRPRPRARRRSRHRRTTWPGRTARRRCSATPHCPPRPGSRWTAPATTPTSTRSTAPPGRCRIGVVRARIGRDARRRRPAGAHHRLRPADVAAASGVAVAGGRRRPQDPADRRGGPPRHGHVQRRGLPRPVRPPGDARPGPVRVGRRPGVQPRRHHHDRHHQLHRHHRTR